MWCTRWFLPLLLLPLPTASPYFLVLFLFSLTMHAKPCFYCIVLLTTIFVSSCYWQPLPSETPLSLPWAENVSTFADAWHDLTQYNSSKELPDVVQLVDRCWCDFSSGGFFEPYNVTHWEYVSLQRVKSDLENEKKAEETKAGTTENVASNLTPSTTTTSTSKPRALTSLQKTVLAGSFTMESIRSLIHEMTGIKRDFVSPSLQQPSSTTANLVPNIPVQTETTSHKVLPLLRKEYDFRPYGFGVVVDFSWTL